MGIITGTTVVSRKLLRLSLSLGALSAALLCSSAGVSRAQTPADPQTVSASSDNIWWKHAVIDELYPRSFQDSNGDGVGDLNGITQRMGYIESLGVDAIWIAPMYPSPQVDFGYDISDYDNVDPQYGTLADFDKLLASGKAHHVRVILDMVLNHTSDKHQWFIDSASSRTNPKADWYVWNDGVDASTPGLQPIQLKAVHDGKAPPNNWESIFGGSAWEWVPARKQFYYHKFYIQQPDLNWRNPAVETAAFDAMRFWLDRGVAGFRLDAIPTLFEDPQLRNEPVKEAGVNKQGDPIYDDIYTSNLPGVHDVIRRMRAMVASYPGDRVLIGETYLPNTAELDKWYGGTAKDELQLPMDMLVGFDNRDYGKLDVASIRAHINEVETQVHGSQPLIVFDNHDNTRAIDRFGDGVHNMLINKLLDTILFTTRATVLTYYGEELGMPTTTPTEKSQVKDPIGITGWPNEKGRDGERTPMQWTPGPQAGFSTNANTWLPIPASFKQINVETESKEPDSDLSWFKQTIALRRANPALRNGTQTMINTDSSTVLAYVRSTGKDSAVVAVNFTAQPQTVTLDLSGSGVSGKKVKTLLTDAASLKSQSSLNVTLPPFASWIAKVE